MGMFDWISIDKKWQPEPRPPWLDDALSKEPFQSKSLTCWDTWKIEEDGALYVKKDGAWERSVFTGEVVFYTTPPYGHPLYKAGRPDQNAMPWYEAMLLVLDGKVIASKHVNTRAEWGTIP